MSSFQGSRLDEVFLIAFLTKGAFIVSKQLPWARWCLSNQWQAQKMPTGYNLKRWGYAKCHRCGPPCNNSEHIMTCSGINCTNENLRTLDEIAKMKMRQLMAPDWYNRNRIVSCAGFELTTSCVMRRHA